MFFEKGVGCDPLASAAVAPEFRKRHREDPPAIGGLCAGQQPVRGGAIRGSSHFEKIKVARPARLELATLCLEGRCSIQLSYGRVVTNLQQYKALTPLYFD